MRKIIETIFSVKNANNHKVVTILGLKLKFANKNKILMNKLEELNYSINSLNQLQNNPKLNDINCTIKSLSNNINQLQVNPILNDINSNIKTLNNKNEFNLASRTMQILSREIMDKFYGVVEGAMFSPYNTLLKEAHEEAIDFIKNNVDLNKVLFKKERLNNLRYSVSLTDTNGLFLEFGVFSGQTINLIADNKNVEVYGFDSFEGLPEDWNGWSIEKGFFKRNELPSVRDNVTLIKGWFNETLPDFLKEHNETVSFLHVDCDIYSSAKYVLQTLKDRIKSGTIIVFDEFFNYPNWKNHEYKAFMEFIEETNFNYEYVSIGRDQITVRIL